MTLPVLLGPPLGAGAIAGARKWLLVTSNNAFVNETLNEIGEMAKTAGKPLNDVQVHQLSEMLKNASKSEYELTWRRFSGAVPGITLTGKMSRWKAGAEYGYLGKAVENSMPKIIGRLNDVEVKKLDAELAKAMTELGLLDNGKVTQKLSDMVKLNFQFELSNAMFFRGGYQRLLSKIPGLKPFKKPAAVEAAESQRGLKFFSKISDADVPKLGEQFAQIKIGNRVGIGETSAENEQLARRMVQILKEQPGRQMVPPRDILPRDAARMVLQEFAQAKGMDWLKERGGKQWIEIAGDEMAHVGAGKWAMAIVKEYGGKGLELGKEGAKIGMEEGAKLIKYLAENPKVLKRLGVGVAIVVGVTATTIVVYNLAKPDEKVEVTAPIGAPAPSTGPVPGIRPGETPTTTAPQEAMAGNEVTAGIIVDAINSLVKEGKVDMKKLQGLGYDPSFVAGLDNDKQQALLQAVTTTADPVEIYGFFETYSTKK